MSDNTIALIFGLYMILMPLAVLVLAYRLGRHDARVSSTEADEFDKLKIYADALNSRCIEDTATVGRLTAEQAVMRQWIADVLPALEGVNLEDALPDFSALVESGRRLVDGGPDDLLKDA